MKEACAIKVQMGTADGEWVSYPSGWYWELHESGALTVCDSDDDPVAVYAHGRWLHVTTFDRTPA